MDSVEVSEFSFTEPAKKAEEFRLVGPALTRGNDFKHVAIRRTVRYPQS